MISNLTRTDLGNFECHDESKVMPCRYNATNIKDRIVK